MSKKDNYEEMIDENLDEESVASATLKAGSRPAGEDPKSKIDYMTKTLGIMNGMKILSLIM